MSLCANGSCTFAVLPGRSLCLRCDPDGLYSELRATLDRFDRAIDNVLRAARTGDRGETHRQLMAAYTWGWNEGVGAAQIMASPSPVTPAENDAEKEQREEALSNQFIMWLGNLVQACHEEDTQKVMRIMAGIYNSGFGRGRAVSTPRPAAPEWLTNSAPGQ